MQEPHTLTEFKLPPGVNLVLCETEKIVVTLDNGINLIFTVKDGRPCLSF